MIDYRRAWNLSAPEVLHVDTDRDHETPYFHSSTFVEEGGINQKLKVLPLTWFYGGKEPADNPFLPRAHEPASP